MHNYIDLSNKGLLRISEYFCNKVLCDDLAIKASNNPIPNTLIRVNEGFEYLARFYVLNQGFLCKYNTDEINRYNLLRVQDLKLNELEQIIDFCTSRRLLLSTESIINLVKKYYKTFDNALEKNKELILNIGLLNINLRDYIWSKTYPKENKVKINDFEIIL